MIDGLLNFVRESNRIEGITRAPSKGEMAAHERVLSLQAVAVDDLAAFVLQVAGAPLRDQPGMNVRVGDHVPMPGGPAVRTELLLQRVHDWGHPFHVHFDYETLHPFMDGNGRSGRVLWLWQMTHQSQDSYVLKRGFLHTWYYQSLQEGGR